MAKKENVINQKQLEKEVKESLENRYKREEISEVINVLKKVIIDEVVSGKEVILSGLGKFTSYYRTPRKAIDVTDISKKVDIEGRRVGKFRAGQTLKRELNK